jgi:transposase
MEALYLKSQGFKNLKIADVLQITRRTLQKWIHIFNKEGIEGLKKFHHKGQKSKLHGFSESIEEYFRSNPPRSIREACLKIEQLTGLKRTETSVRGFLKSLGMSVRKSGSVPGKANLEAQEEFKKKSSNQYWLMPGKAKKKFSS